MPPTLPEAGSTTPAAGELRAAILTWFAANARELPWRDGNRTPWGVLVSEVMLQQTPVARVLPAWQDWMSRWPQPGDLAAASTADVLRVWANLGYPRRALRLQECARAVVDRHGGVVPRDETALLALPGVGAYTAAAVVAFAFGGRSVVLDTNVRRVLARAIAGLALPAPSQTVAEVRVAAALVPTSAPEAALWAAASMELGALVCTARAPRCVVCPVAQLCTWRAAGHPGDEHVARRRPQGFAGTDRQVRGKIMAVVREASEPVARASVEALWPDATQLRRSLGSLVHDGLVREVLDARGEPSFELPDSRRGVSPAR